MRLLLVLFATLLLAPGMAAQTIRPDPDPGTPGEGFIDYVGRYGEVFKLRGGWQTVPFMKGDVEILNLYPEFRADRPAWDLVKFDPKPSDFAPENFTRLHLIQLAIIPRASDAFRSLDDLKKAKIRDLESTGAYFEVIDRPLFNAFRGDWPAGTFEIRVHSPYQLTQLYTANSAYTCILTAGIGNVINSHYGFLRYGLATWIVPQDRPVPDESPRATISQGLSFHPFTLPPVWGSWLLITGLGCLLAGSRVKKGTTVRRISLAVAIFSNAGAVIGGTLGLILWPFAWVTHHFAVPSAIACVLMPLAAYAMRRSGRMAGTHHAMLAVSLWSAAASVVIGYYSRLDWGGGDNARYQLAFNAIISFAFFAIGGGIFGLFDSARTGSRPTLVMLCALFLTTRAAAQSLSSNTELESLARTNLSARHITQDGLRKTVVASMRAEGTYYDYQRVEIKGVFSPNSAANDTNGTFGKLFDIPVAPTRSDPNADDSISNWIRDLKNKAKDLKDLDQDQKNRLSAHAEAVVRALANKDVNEIVAHSWGTEIVYNAILAGVINAPRKLIVCGMPDKDLPKWKALAEHTGTEVIVYTNESDPIADAGRGHHEAVHEGHYSDWPTRMGALAFGFNRQWDEACHTTVTCNPYHRAPPPVAFKGKYQQPTHDRLEYYQAMIDEHDLPDEPAEQKLFPPKKGEEPPPFPGSAPAMAADQEKTVNEKAEDLYEEAIRHEMDNIRDAELDGIGQDDGGIVDLANKAGQSARNAREAARALSARDQAAAERRAKDFQDLQEKGWRYLKSAVGLACHDPQEFWKNYQQHRIIGVELDAIFMDEHLRRDAGSLNECQKLILYEISAHPKYMTIADVYWKADGYRKAHPGFFSRLFSSISDFFSAEGDYTTAADARDRDAEREARQEQKGEPPIRGHFNEGLAYRQLRGMAP